MKYMLITIAAVIIAGSGLSSRATDSNRLFPNDRLTVVEVIMDTNDWDTMRREHHDLFTAPAPESGHRASPYNYYRATAIIDGERIENVGVRKKGFLGSASAHRPSLKLNFDKFVKGREFRGLDLMTLNNNDQDASQLKQYLAYKLFNEGGVESPRCALTKVTVNGKYLGVYSHVESVNKKFVKRRFGDGKGNLYEGQGADFRKGFFDKFEKKSNKKKSDYSDVEALTRSLESDQEGLFKSLEKVLNVDQYLRYWTMESLVGHRDSYSANQNNFLIYNEPKSGQFHFIPWGTDGAFEWRETKYSAFKRPDSVKAEGYVAHRIYKHPDGPMRYRQQMRSHLQTVWNEKVLLAELKRMQALVAPHVHLPEEAFKKGVSQLETYIKRRRAMFEPELSGPAPEWKLPLRKPRTSNSKPLGTITGSFKTIFGVAPNHPDARGTIEVKIDGMPRRFDGTNVTGSVRDGAFRTGYPIVSVTAQEDGTMRGMSFYLIIDPDFFGSNQEQPIDGYTVFSQLRQSTGNPPVISRLGYIVGTVRIESAGMEKGDLISGTLDAKIRGRAKPADWKD